MMVAYDHHHHQLIIIAFYLSACASSGSQIPRQCLKLTCANLHTFNLRAICHLLASNRLIWFARLLAKRENPSENDTGFQAH